MKEIFREVDTQVKDTIKMDLTEVGCNPGDWIALSEDRDQCRAYVRAVMNLQVP